MLRLNYIFPGATAPRQTKIDVTGKDENKRTWLYSMVENFPDTIFFLTVDSTDIWD